ncbi:MAG TPA: hypothetical protein VD738_00935 [Nitrospira sp.]|nr:hypothetical protein [Nitrospira sp.]
MGMLCLASAAGAQPSADQVLTDPGYSAGDKQRVVKGEYDSGEIAAVSERDLTFAVAFWSRYLPTRSSRRSWWAMADAQVQKYGKIGVPGSLADLAELQITAEEANALSKAEPCEKVNLSKGEMVGFKIQLGASLHTVIGGSRGRTRDEALRSAKAMLP